MSAKNAVLGLVIERPGYGYELAQRMRERFGSAQFVNANVYSALDRLERQQLVQVVGSESAEAPSSPSVGWRLPRTKYEATAKGVEHFRGWLRASSSLPLVREELQVKIALCEPRDLTRLIEVVYGEELTCLGRLEDLKRDARVQQLDDERAWSATMSTIALSAETAFWDARIEWLQRVRMYLEQLRGEAELHLNGSRLGV